MGYLSLMENIRASFHPAGIENFSWCKYLTKTYQMGDMGSSVASPILLMSHEGVPWWRALGVLEMQSRWRTNNDTE
jgi:hypothetical protein